jgi:hypothetical protein
LRGVGSESASSASECIAILPQPLSGFLRGPNALLMKVLHPNRLLRAVLHACRGPNRPNRHQPPCARQSQQTANPLCCGLPVLTTKSAPESWSAQPSHQDRLGSRCQRTATCFAPLAFVAGISFVLTAEEGRSKDTLYRYPGTFRAISSLPRSVSLQRRIAWASSRYIWEHKPSCLSPSPFSTDSCSYVMIMITTVE